jgi:hypothetical protein
MKVGDLATDTIEGRSGILIRRFEHTRGKVFFLIDYIGDFHVSQNWREPRYLKKM